MQYWLDIVGSFFVGGIIILIILNLNIFMGTSAAENQNTNISQGHLVSIADLIEHDIYKIGYRITGEKIIVADSSELKFYSDINNSGSRDSIHYYLGKSSEMFATFNPNDKALYRVLNNENPVASNVVVDFKLNYHDSLGAVIDYTSLKNASSRQRIRTITVYLYVEPSDPVEGVYHGAEWKKNIIPKNL